MIDVGIILLSIIMLVFCAYRGFSVLILAPLIAAFTVFISRNQPLLAYYTQIFMVNLGNFTITYFPLFLLSAIFGKIMENSGSAKAIADYIANKIGAERAILAVVLSCGILTYGGVSLFVVAFTVYPIAVELFKASDTPKRLMPSAIALGSFTFTMVSLPGTPAIQNAIPSQYFGTNTFAAPGVGIICSVIMFALGMWWLLRQYAISKENSEGYGDHQESKSAILSKNDIPNFWIAVAPIFIVIVMNYVCIKFIFPNIDTSYLSDKKFGAVDIKTVASNWAIIVSIFLSIIFLLVAHYRKIDVIKCLNTGASDSLSPIFNTASVVGYGSVINNLAGFSIIKNCILNISGGNPLISSAFITGVLGGITGSASGGLSISLQMMGHQYLEMANSMGISPDALHRVISIASAALNTLPHNGAVITLLAICGMTHRDSYKDIAITSLVGPFVTTILAVILCLTFGAF